nr:hypothetical protein [Tanacetum cinerariifolium]
MLARKKELKACGTLLMALPDKHQLKFNSHKDAKTLMEAIEKRFGGNTETKKTDVEEQSLDDLLNSLKIYEAEVKSSSSASTSTQYIAFVSSSNTDICIEPVSAAASVSAICEKMPVSSLPNIDADDLEEMDLKWQMAMLTIRARRFFQRTRRNLKANGPTSMGFDMSKVECYNCHKKGHFLRECRSPKDTRRNSDAEPQRRNVSVETTTSNALLRDNALVNLRQTLEKQEQERDDLKLKLEKFQTYSKNLTELLASQTNAKTGLGYNSQVFTRVMFDCDDYISSGSDESLSPSLIYDRYQSGNRYHAIPLPYTGTFMPPKPDLVFNNAPTDVKTDHPAFTVMLSSTKPDQDLSLTNRSSAPIIEDWVSDSEDESETKTQQNPASPKPTSNGTRRDRKACFVCKSLDHLIKDCDYHDKKMARPNNRNHAHRGNHKQYALMTHQNPQRHLVPAAVLTQSKPVPITAVRPASTIVPKFRVTRPRHAKPIVTKFNSPNRRHTNRRPSLKVSNSPPRVIVVQALVVNAAQGIQGKWEWKPKCPILNLVSRNTSASMTLKRFDYNDALRRSKSDKGVTDSGCSRHMKGNISYLSDFEELNGGYVTFVPKGTPSIGFMRPFGYPVTILNTLDSLGKFDGKVDEGFLVGYSVSSKAFRVFNSRTRIVQETLHVNFLENKPNVTGGGPTWLFDIDTLTKTMNYQPVTAGNQSNHSVDAAFNEKEPEFDVKKPDSEVNVSPSSSTQSQKHDDKTKREDKGKSHVESFKGYRNLSEEFKDYSEDNINEVNAVELEDITYSDDEDDVGAEADFNNLQTSIIVSPIPTTRVHKDHPVTQIINDLSSTTQIRSMERVAKDQETKRVHQALKDPSWIEAIQEELLQFKMQKVWVLVDLPHGKRVIGGGINYEEFFAPVARIEAIRLFLAYASFMGFMVYQMDVKSAFLDGTIEEELYVCQPLGFEDPIHPVKVYKVVKELYGLHQALRAWQKGLQVKQKKDGIYISQDEYVAEILRKFRLTDEKLASTPIDTKKPLLKDPDDSDYAGASLDRKSTTRGCQFLGCRLIFWQYKKQTIRATSSTKAEYVATASCCAQVLRSQNQLLDYGLTMQVVLSSMESLKRMLHVTNILSVGYLTTQQMVLNSPCLTHIKNLLVQIKRSLSWLVQKQTALGKDKRNPLIVDSLLKTIWSSIHHLLINKVLTISGQTATGVNTPRSDEDMLELMELTIFLLPSDEKVRVKVSVVDLQVSDVRLFLLLLAQKFLLFSLMNWCCSLSAVSEGFNQIIDFLNGSSIKYALTVNPNIYVSCIKQFWTTVAVKKVNDVMRLQALVDKKKVVVTEATIRDALCLDDAEGVECLPNEEIFAELARIRYEKPSTKLKFYKAFFSSQWKFLIHTILQCISAKRISWNEFSSSMASAVICLSSGRKFNFSKYIFNSLVRNVDSPSKFYMYPCFLQLMIRKQVGDLSIHTTKYTSPALTQKMFANMRRVGKGFSRVYTPLFKEMLVAQEVEEGDADENVENVNAGDAAEGDVNAANDEVQPPSPQPQPQPLQDAGLPMNLLQEQMDTYTTLIRRVKHLKQDKVAQAMEITKLKQRVKKLERRNKVRMIAKMDQDVDERTAESQAEIYKIDLDHANKVLSIHEDEFEPVEVQEVVDVVTTAKLIIKVATAASTTITAVEVLIPAATITAAVSTLTAATSRRTKGVVIRNPEESTTTTSIKVHSEARSKDKGPIFEAKFNSNVTFLQKIKEQIEEDVSRALKRINETLAKKAAKRQKLDEEMLNALRLEVKEKSEVSLELLSFGVDTAKEFKEKHAKCLMMLVKDLVLPSQDDAVD